MIRFFFCLLLVEAAPNRLEPGTLIPTTSVGVLRVIEQIGEGRNAFVYRTEPTTDPTRFYAVKVIAEKDKDIREREVEVLTALNATEGFPKIFDAPESLIVMEMLEGKSLDKFEASSCPISIEEIAIQLLSRLKAVHEAGFVHVDMHRRNIMLEENGGQVALLDFGLAVRIQEPKNPLYVNLLLSSAQEQARSPLYPIDDIERLLYVLISLQASLPWTNLVKMRDGMDKEKRSRDVESVLAALEARILAMKLNFFHDDSFFDNMTHTAFRKALGYISEVRALRERASFQIDYSYLQSLFRSAAAPLLPIDPLLKQDPVKEKRSPTLIPIKY